MSTGTDIETVSEYVDSSVTAVEKIDRLKNPAAVVYSTIDDSTFEGRLRTVSALQDTVPLRDHLGEVIELSDIVTQVVQVRVQDTPTSPVRMVETPRVILVAANGVAYHSVATGVLDAVTTLIGGLGHPSEWPDHKVKVTATENQTRSGYRVITLVPVI